MIDDSARSCCGSAPHAHWRNKKRVGADKRIVFDTRFLFDGCPIVVTGDGARRDIDVFPNRSVAHIAEVVHLRARANGRFLNLGVIPQSDATGKVCPRPQMAHWPDMYFGIQRSLFQPGTDDFTGVTDLAVADDAVRSDETIAANRRVAANRGKRA